MAKINGLNTTLPKATEEILRQIIHHDRVKEHRVVHCDDNRVVLECDWEVKLGSRDLEKGFSAKGVQAIEPVCWHIPFVFPNAPILPSLRKNFPRTKFPHINPSKALDVVWPCITENGITSFLLANGLVKLIAQMDSWLDRAALDRLMVDEQGWEPIIFDNYGGSFIDVDSTLIPCALEVIDKQTITAKVAEEKGAFHTFSNRPLYVFAASDDSSGAHAPIDILELFLPESSATKQFQNIPVTNREELLSFAKSLEGIPELHNNLIVLPTPDFSASEWLRIKLDNLDKTFPHLKANRKNSNAIGCIVIFCIPRPAHIIGGSSNIEVTPFFVRLSNDKNTNPEVVPLTYIQSCSQEVLQNVSHPYKREVKHLAFLGTGSVGSKIAISLARSGSYSIHLVDNGVFKPHNMARYGIAGVGVHEGWPKATILASTIRNLGVPSTAYISNLSNELITLAQDVDLLIESTGNELVSYNLSSLENLPGRLCQVGLYGESTMGYLALEPYSKCREIRIDDLEAFLYASSLTDTDIAKALYGNKSAERQIVGYGCSSETTIMPDTALNLCCAAITEKIDNFLYQQPDKTDHGELHLCFRGDDSSVNWKSYLVPPTKKISFKYDDREWEVRVSGFATESMYKQRSEKLPSETGGAIIGYICELTGRIYVTNALQAFQESVESPVEFSFDQTKLHDLDRELRSASLGRIYVVGTWHSHTVPSQPSELDKKTLAELNGSFSLPITTMLMCDGRDIVAVEK